MTNRYYTKGSFIYGSGFFYSWTSFSADASTIDWKFILTFSKYNDLNQAVNKLTKNPVWDALLDTNDIKTNRYIHTWYNLKPHVVNWLNENTRGWAVNPHDENRSDSSDMKIFLSRRSEVLAFIKEFGNMPMVKAGKNTGQY